MGINASFASLLARTATAFAATTTLVASLTAATTTATVNCCWCTTLVAMLTAATTAAACYGSTGCGSKCHFCSVSIYRTLLKF